MEGAYICPRAGSYEAVCLACRGNAAIQSPPATTWRANLNCPYVDEIRRRGMPPEHAQRSAWESGALPDYLQPCQQRHLEISQQK